MKRALFTLVFSTVLLSCTKDSPSEKGPEDSQDLMETITSAAVAFAYEEAELQDFFADPGTAYVRGFFRFPETLKEDVVFGLDIEWFEGVETPIHFEGADWMALAGLSRNGILWIPLGSPENLEGVPTNTDLWEIFDLQYEIQPDTWYEMTVIADFSLREFRSVRLKGPDVDITQDLSGYPLEYPNYIPFDKPSLTYYAFALRSKEFAPENPSGTDVYFDDMEIGIEVNGTLVPLAQNGFEGQARIQDIPLQLPVIPLDNVQQHFWYFENEDAKVSLVDQEGRNGSRALRCDADLLRR